VREKKPVTEPEMTRFLLPLKEAIHLIGFALKNGRQGNFFVSNAPSATIGDLAQALKNVFSSDSEIKTIGMRHGEKMHETLASKD
jgi:UDP-N-acetylglucosamine 4,6-dehydratase/5-epimerase